MNATTVAVDLAKNVFELAVADASWKVIERARLTRSQFERWFDNRKVDQVVMEACGSAHHWGRWLEARGIGVKLLPAQYVRAYVKRNKTDSADAAALLEAARASDIKLVAVKSIEQQALQALHRLRSGWMATRIRRINTLRGFCREFGLEVRVGAVQGLAAIARLIADDHSAIPALLRTPMRLALEEIRLMEARIGNLERELARGCQKFCVWAARVVVHGFRMNRSPNCNAICVLAACQLMGGFFHLAVTLRKTSQMSLLAASSEGK